MWFYFPPVSSAPAITSLCPHEDLGELYGSPFSLDSMNSPFGVGNSYNTSSPSNPYRRGLRIEGR